MRYKCYIRTGYNKTCSYLSVVFFSFQFKRVREIEKSYLFLVNSRMKELSGEVFLVYIMYRSSRFFPRQFSPCRSFPLGFFTARFFPPVLSLLGIFPAGFFPDIFLNRKSSKRNQTKPNLSLSYIIRSNLT